jgi:5-methylcytosine-specific restriction enzyme A
MPRRGLRVCGHPGCPQLTKETRCPAHQAQVRADQRQHYSGIPGVNYGRRWRHARRRFLAEHPWCPDCEREGWLEPAVEVDHHVPHEGNYERFWDESNWRALCKRHHSAKTAREVLRRYD